MDPNTRIISIDVIIPSFRLQEAYLIPIVSMEVPERVKVRYIVVADNPEIQISRTFQECVDGEAVILLINKENLGAHLSRNVGLDHSHAEWVLFIDDDVKPHPRLLFTYMDAIKERPEEIGFFGETLFPAPRTIFAKGVIACDILTFFFLAGYYDALKWAPTANVLIRRDAIAQTRFQSIFPKAGGGEDIDFFLQIYRKTGKELQCLQGAAVYHDWWYNQRRNYTRFIRWSYGDSLLHEIFPEYTYYNFPNVIESLFLGGAIGLILAIAFGVYWLPLSIVMGIIIGEIIVEWIRLLVHKSIIQSVFVIEAVLIRASNDIGRLSMQLLRRKRIAGICERFDHFCDGKHIRYQRIWAGFKFIGYALAAYGIGYLCS